MSEAKPLNVTKRSRPALRTGPAHNHRVKALRLAKQVIVVRRTFALTR
jgi:hypothetical protein